MRGARPLMVSCGAAAAIPGRQRSMGKISGFDVVDGSVRIYVRSMGWRARQRAVRGADDEAVLVAVVGLASGWLVGVLGRRRRLVPSTCRGQGR